MDISLIVIYSYNFCCVMLTVQKVRDGKEFRVEHQLLKIIYNFLNNEKYNLCFHRLPRRFGKKKVLFHVVKNRYIE